MILSIIIPMYNVERYVEKCIKSCVAQNIPYEDYEIICVNDGSPDKSMDIANNLSNDFKNISVINQENGGLSVARNTGIEYAKGEYLMFVDSDDWITENSLLQIKNKLNIEKPDALVFCASNTDGFEEKRRWSFSDEFPVSGRDYLKGFVPDGAPFAVWRRDLFSRYDFKFKKGILHEDSELTPRMYYRCAKVSKLNLIIYHVYQNPNSITRSINYKRAFDYVGEVCVSLDCFCNDVEEEYKYIFHNRISMYINNALHIVSNSPIDVQQKFNACINDHKNLLVHLRQSTKWKYKIQYCIFKMTGCKYISVYNLLKRIS